jgi:uncharacterized lipoprotein NlpE involved in copper resistance
MKLLLLAIPVTLLVGCSDKSQSTPSVMSKERAIYILNNEDPYSKEAVKAIQHHLRAERAEEKKLRYERIMRGESVPDTGFGSSEHSYDNSEINSEQGS